MKSKVWAGYLIATLICTALLVINDRRYAGHISGFWYFAFSGCLFVMCLFIEQHRKYLITLSSGVLVVLLVAYLYTLPPFTYESAVECLQKHYTEESFFSSPVQKNQALAPHIKDGEIMYYRYIAESSEKQFFFDQYTGDYGEVTTAPK